MITLLLIILALISFGVSIYVIGFWKMLLIFIICTIIAITIKFFLHRIFNNGY